jgi:hypothetical protein
MQLTLAGQRMPQAVRGLSVPLTGTINNPKLSKTKFVEAIGRQGLQQLLQRGLDEAAKDDGQTQQKNGQNDKREVEDILGDIIRGGRKDSAPTQQRNNQNDQKQQPNQKPNEDDENQPDKPKNPLEGLFNQIRDKDEE